jgi:hypothetical protein
MKNIIFILLLFVASYANAQVTTSKVVIVPNASAIFNTGIPAGNILIDMNTKKEYLTLIPIASTKSISTLTLNTDISDIPSNLSTYIKLSDSTKYTTPYRNSLKLSISDSTIKYVTPYQLILSLPEGFELEVVTSGLTQITVPFTLSNRTLVWYNGAILSKNLWTGVGTTSITLFVDTKQKDLLKIQNQ